VTPMPSCWWLRAFMVGGINAADDQIDLGIQANSRHDVRAVLARSARIAGTVSDVTSRTPTLVVAFPVERDKRYGGSRYVRTAIVGADGHYAVDVPPGQYWVATLSANEPLSDAVLTRLEAVSIAAAATEARESRVDLRAAPGR
jgi:hypothetical protein